MARYLIFIFCLLILSSCGTRRSSMRVQDYQSHQTDYHHTDTQSHTQEQRDSSSYSSSVTTTTSQSGSEVIHEHTVSVTDSAGNTTTTTDRTIRRTGSQSTHSHAEQQAASSSTSCASDSAASLVDSTAHHVHASDSTAHVRESGSADARPWWVRWMETAKHLFYGSLMAWLVYLIYKYIYNK